jgi:hypothetical protein
MSELSDTHNIQITNLEILVLEYILEDLDVDLELNFTDGKKNILFRYYCWLCAEIKGSRK